VLGGEGDTTLSQSAGLSSCPFPFGTHGNILRYRFDCYCKNRRVTFCLTRGQVLCVCHVSWSLTGLHSYVLWLVNKDSVITVFAQCIGYIGAG
jgi:hypothetical protein